MIVSFSIFLMTSFSFCHCYNDMLSCAGLSKAVAVPWRMECRTSISSAPA